MSGLHTQPTQRILNRAHGGALRQLRAINQYDRAAQLPRGVQLRPGALPARVLGHHMGDAVSLHQGQVMVQRERAAVYDHGAPALWECQTGVDQPQQVPVLGLVEERRHVLPANRQEHPGRALGQGCQGAGHIGCVLPFVTGLCLPGRALQCQQRQRHFGAGLHRVATHLGSKRVRGVDHMGDGLGLQAITQPGHTAKATHTGGQGLRHGRMGSPSVRKNSGHAGRGQCLCQLAGFGGATQQEDTSHG